MAMPDAAQTDLALARRVASRHGAGAVRFLGEGANNLVWRADGTDGAIVVKLNKPHRAGFAPDEYAKEAWASAAARRHGVQTPAILAHGAIEGRMFQIQEGIEGRAPRPDEALGVWRVLGEMARRCHAIAVEGWGFRLRTDGVFAENWQAHLSYNITSLTPDDVLIARGTIDRAISRRLRGAFEHLAAQDFRFGLCHGDMALSNTLIDGAGTVWLLDWGSAAAHVVPHYEINEIRRGPAPGREALGAFLDGYGMAPAAHAALGRERRALAALREIDTLRWALEHDPDMVAQMSARAAAAAAKVEA